MRYDLIYWSSLRKLYERSTCSKLACENIRFSSLFAAGGVSRGVTFLPSRETFPAAKSEEKRMFSQASSVLQGHSIAVLLDLSIEFLGLKIKTKSNNPQQNSSRQRVIHLLFHHII